MSEPTKEIVPLHEADVDLEPATDFGDGIKYRFDGDRSVSVFASKDGRRFVVQIRRPTNDGKTAELMFGLTESAAVALQVGLTHHLNGKAAVVLEDES